MPRLLPFLWHLPSLCLADGRLEWPAVAKDGCAWSRNISSQYMSKEDCFFECERQSDCKAVFIWENNGQLQPSCVLMSETCIPNAFACDADSWCSYNKPSISLWPLTGLNSCQWQHDFSDELPTSPRYASAQDCFDACGQSSRCQAVFIWQENNQEKPSCVYMSQACDVNADTCGPADWCAYNKPGQSPATPATSSAQGHCHRCLGLLYGVWLVWTIGATSKRI
mmetsp:Transcript_77682/g.171606  ORF Transcript_77682/g.171606 Transcript_77682/m.171606 type:complete len:224 (-) Transcript_77682:148-819(-)